MFSGSARANATTIMPTTTNDDRTIAARLISGDFLHNGTNPMGPNAAPISEPPSVALEVSRSLRRYTRRVITPPTTPQNINQRIVNQKILEYCIN
jgi:hypothetical protein